MHLTQSPICIYAKDKRVPFISFESMWCAVCVKVFHMDCVLKTKTLGHDSIQTDVFTAVKLYMKR